MFANFIDDDGEENHQSTVGFIVGGQTVGVMQMEALLLDLSDLKSTGAHVESSNR